MTAGCQQRQPSPSWQRAGLAGLAVWVSVVSAAAGFAQNPARPFRETVSIPLDGEANKKLQILEDRLAAGQWDAVVEALLELLETHQDGMVSLESGTPGGVARYGLVQAACERLLTTIPPEGLAAYRRRVDPLAERWLQTATASHDRTALERLVQQAYYSSWGDEALWLLGQAAWNEGDFAAARRWWSQLLPQDVGAPGKRYPDPSQPPAEVAARCLLCRIFEGDLGRAEVEFRQFVERYGETPGVLAGREQPWRLHLETVLAESQTWPRSTNPDDVPTYGGSPARTTISPRAIDIGSELWSVPLKPVYLPETPRTTLFPVWPPLAYHPVVVDGRIYLTDGGRIQAWRLADGQPVWGESATIYPLIDDEIPLFPTRSAFGGPCWTVTVDAGRLYARMGSVVTNPSVKEFRDLPNELVCLDVGAGEGRLLWKLTGEEFSQRVQEPAESASWSWEGAPLVAGGRLYAALSRRRQQLEWSLACLDAETGALLWHRLVGVSRTTPNENENRVSQLLLTLGDGRLYLSTDWGAVVAVDAADGRWSWAVTYESQGVSWPAVVPAPRIAPAPCLYSEGQVFVAPSDAQRVFCLEAATGTLRWQRRVMEPLSHLVGVAQGRLIAAGNSLWAFHTDTGQLDWSVRQVEPEDFGYGRGWLAGDAVYWPTRRAVLVISQRSGQILREHPLAFPHHHRMGGNVVIAQDRLLIASADRLTVYGEGAAPPPTHTDVLSQHTASARLNTQVASHRPIPPPTTRVKHRPAADAHPADPPASMLRPAATLPSLSPSSQPPAETLGYWRRAWQRKHAPTIRCLLPDGTPPSPAHAVVLCQPWPSPELQGWDRSTGQLRWQFPLAEPILWSRYGSRSLVVASSRELCALSSDTGTIRWRHPWTSLLDDIPTLSTSLSATAAAECSWTPFGLVVSLPPWGVVGVDELQGHVLWRYMPAARHWRMVLDHETGQLLITERFDRDSTRLWSFATGSLVPVTRSLPRSFRRGYAAGLNGWVIETDDRRLEWWSAKLKPWAEYVGPLSTAHTDPWVFRRGEDWYLVNDGVSVIGLKGDQTGRFWPTWTQALARGPLLQPDQQAARDQRLLFTATSGLLRAIDLTTGQIAWERRLRTTSPQKVVLVGDRDDTFGSVAVVPWSDTAQTDEVPFFDRQTGQPWQRIRLAEPSSRISLQQDDQGLVMNTPAETLALTLRVR